jgi:ribosome-binding protein aMBF1 (putative translation factor)
MSENADHKKLISQPPYIPLYRVSLDANRRNGNEQGPPRIRRQVTILRNQAERLRAMRLSCGLSQVELARALRHTQATISAWERKGTIHEAHLAAFEELARRLEVKRIRHLPSVREAAARLAASVLDENRTDAIAIAKETLLLLTKGRT